MELDVTLQDGDVASTTDGAVAITVTVLAMCHLQQSETYQLVPRCYYSLTIGEDLTLS